MQEISKILPNRSSRGQRSAPLVGAAVDDDKSFWDQDAFKEDSGDSEFDSTVASSDSEDSDIDNDEGEHKNPSDNEDDVGERSTAVRSRNGYVDPGMRQKLGARGLLAAALVGG